MDGSSELTPSEKELLKYTVECDFENVKCLVTEGKVNVNCVDDDGWTPLQHAAYKGNYNLCKLLLDCGADVNLTYHNTQYSALTFAGLSGKLNVVSLLLEYGASISKVNSINKTAAQMAAFVGNHNVVNIINNFIPLEEIEYFTRVHGLEKEPKLPPTLCHPVHKMAIMTNIHPVRLVMYIQDNLCLLEHAKKVKRVFNNLCEKQLKSEDNELLSLKFHHLAFIINACESFICERESKDSQNTEYKDILNLLIRNWIKGDEKGFPILLEKLLRQDIREYPYTDCSMFQQLVRTLAPVKIGDEPSAIFIISETVNGQRGLENSVCCSTCGEPCAEKKCSVCKSVYYCDKNCQKLHWFTHKIFCAELVKCCQKSEANNKIEKENKELKSEESSVAKLKTETEVKQDS